MSNSNNEPYADFEFIAVDYAKALLALNKPYEIGVVGTNRPLRPRLVKQYAEDMLAGNWEVTSQGIAIARDNNGHEIVIDGQHRLHAIVLAGETNPAIRVLMAVTRNLDPSAALVIDTALRRTNGDVVAMEFGSRYPLIVASAAKLTHLYDTAPWSLNTWTAFRPSHSQVLEFVKKYPGMEDAVILASGSNKMGPIPSSPLAAAVYIVRRDRPDVPIEQFIDGLRTGADLPKGSPILTLRDYRANSLALKQRPDGPKMLSIMFKSINSWIKGESRHIVRYNPIEAFPYLTKEAWVAR